MAMALKSEPHWRNGVPISKDFKQEAETRFDAATMRQLANIVRMPDDAALANLHADLIETCAYFQEVIATLPCDLPGAPMNVSLTKRADWLEANVIAPCERLQTAIEEDMRPMFSTWPYPTSVPQFRDNSILKAELNALLAVATELRALLRNQQRDDAGHNQEVRMEVFAAAARLLRKHCPDLKPSRGTYDAELKKRSGMYVDAIRLICQKITGIDDNLACAASWHGRHGRTSARSGGRDRARLAGDHGALTGGMIRASALPAFYPLSRQRRPAGG